MGCIIKRFEHHDVGGKGVFWVVTPCELGGRYQRRDNQFLRNAGIYLQVDTALHPRPDVAFVSGCIKLWMRVK
jgi:hypothetical protein